MASGFAFRGKGSCSGRPPPFFIFHVVPHRFLHVQFLVSAISLGFFRDVAIVLCVHECVSTAVSSLLGFAVSFSIFCGASSIPACGSPAHCNVVHL